MQTSLKSTPSPSPPQQNGKFKQHMHFDEEIQENKWKTTQTQLSKIDRF